MNNIYHMYTMLLL